MSERTNNPVFQGVFIMQRLQTKIQTCIFTATLVKRFTGKWELFQQLIMGTWASKRVEILVSFKF